MRRIERIYIKEESDWFSLISPKFSYKYDYNSKKYKLYKLKNGIRVSNTNVNNIVNFRYIKDFNSFLEIDKKYLIEIFKSDYNDWFINRLNSIYKRKNWKYEWFNINEQIVLKICMSFPETFYKLRNPKIVWNKRGQDRKNFREWCFLIWIWNKNENLIDDFYKNARCELYHFWSIKWNRYIDYEDNEKSSDVIYKKGEANCINLAEFIKKIKKSMWEYIFKLKNNENLYNIFLENYVKDLDDYIKSH